ncbi:hypothetical protein [Clostridium thermarum]|uniref:hypothetical protein n=1 Tax=Clostridium thermarum TaxID=1716543 RepID=UPI00193EDF5C|nr:hypothetical protein [Clostridium thermarum]
MLNNRCIELKSIVEAIGSIGVVDLDENIDALKLATALGVSFGNKVSLLKPFG